MTSVMGRIQRVTRCAGSFHLIAGAFLYPGALTPGVRVRQLASPCEELTGLLDNLDCVFNVNFEGSEGSVNTLPKLWDHHERWALLGSVHAQVAVRSPATAHASRSASRYLTNRPVLMYCGPVPR